MNRDDVMWLCVILHYQAAHRLEDHSVVVPDIFPMLEETERESVLDVRVVDPIST